MALLPAQKIRSMILRDALVALSLANLLLFNLWARALDSAGNYSRDDALPALAVALDTLAIAAVLFCGARLAERFGGWLRELARVSFLLSWLVVANVARLKLSGLILGSVGHSLSLLVAAAAVAAALVIFVRFKREVIALGVKLALVFSPFVPMTFAQAAWQWRKEKRALTVTNESALSLAQKRHHRVVWIVFDELDQRAAFLRRPSDVALPELDGLRAQSWHAENAYPPSKWTMTAIPSLLTGDIVCSLDPTADANDPALKMAGAFKGVPASRIATVFRTAQEQGFRVGVVGWYHPYCHTFAADVARCEDARTLIAERLGLWGQMKRALASDEMIASLPLGYRLLVERRRETRRITHGAEFHLLIYQEVLKAAKQLIIDPSIDLAFVHFPVPHLPVIFNRQTGETTALGEGSYFDNLALVDRTVGELRRALEEAGMWDETTVLMMSDHWWRTDAYDFVLKGNLQAEERPFASLPFDPRVPFLLKLAGVQRESVYDKPFNTVLVRDLVVALLRGELREHEEVDRWFDRKAAGQEQSPYLYLYVCN